jgi:hypothetical protein
VTLRVQYIKQCIGVVRVEERQGKDRPAEKTCSHTKGSADSTSKVPSTFQFPRTMFFELPFYFFIDVNDTPLYLLTKCAILALTYLPRRRGKQTDLLTRVAQQDNHSWRGGSSHVKVDCSTTTTTISNMQRESLIRITTMVRNGNTAKRVGRRDPPLHYGTACQCLWPRPTGC